MTWQQCKHTVAVVLCCRGTKRNPCMLLHVLELSAWSDNGTWGDQCHNRVRSDSTYFRKISSVVNISHQPPHNYLVLCLSTHVMVGMFGNSRTYTYLENEVMTDILFSVRTPKCRFSQFFTFAFNHTVLLYVHSVFRVLQFCKKIKV